ncbi:MAG: hypothetical protein KUG78_20300 [Kangiellaceae bacterium]|nr:hypothetical protein [Kangiellaceae bacterium]
MSIKSNFTKVIAVAGGAVTIADVAQPIAPFASYIMAASAVMCVVFGVIKMLYKSWGETLSVFYFLSMGLFVLSSTMFYFQSQTDDGQRMGVLSTKIGQIESFQQSLGMIEQKLDSIDRTLKSVDTKMDNVKKEVSSDPVKELANLGIAWTGIKFYEAINNNDERVIDLFFKGGMRLGRIGHEYHGFTILTSIIHWPKSNWKAVLEEADSRGYDFNEAVFYHHNLEKAPPLHVAFLQSQFEIANYLINKGVTRAETLALWTKRKVTVQKTIDKKLPDCRPTVSGGIAFTNSDCERRRIYQKRDKAEAKKTMAKIDKIIGILKSN